MFCSTSVKKKSPVFPTFLLSRENKKAKIAEVGSRITAIKEKMETKQVEFVNFYRYFILTDISDAIFLQTTEATKVATVNVPFLFNKTNVMNMKKTLISIVLALAAAPVPAQRLLTLDSCRTLALTNNKQLLASEKEQEAAAYENKAAKTNYLPRLAATASYMRNSREQHLLSSSARSTLSNLGNEMSGPLQQVGQMVGQFHPEAADQLGALESSVVNGMNGVGQKIKDAFRTDTHNLFVGALTITQPVYVGGKIRAYDQITGYARELAEQKHRAGEQEVILSADEAYWQIVSLVHKKKLAESYVQLLQRMDSDVTKMIKSGVATRANALTVSVRLNEAEMALTKVDNGLALARMSLCQICGLPLDSRFTLEDETREPQTQAVADASFNLSTAMSMRPELRSLELASDIYDKKVKIARSEFLPQIALTGNYLLTNPSVFNGFEKKFKGMFNIGVMVSAPLFQWGEEKYKIRAAKAEAAIARYQLDEAREKVELQVNQAAFRVNEANKAFIRAEKNCARAEENLRTANVGFRAGVIPTSDMLEAQTAWVSAQSEKVDAAIDMQLTRIYLQKSLGTLE